MSRNFSDDEIKAFLKKNQPVAPPIDERETREKLLAKLGFTSVPRRQRLPESKPWLAFGSAMAAGLAAIFFMSRPPVVSKTEIPQATSAAEEFNGEFNADTTEFLYEDELPSMEVGDEYLDLMAQNDVHQGSVNK